MRPATPTESGAARSAIAAAQQVIDRGARLAARPVDGASLAFFRMVFGLIMAWGGTRYFSNGWLQLLFDGPTFHFSYAGFAWLPELPPLGMKLVVIALIVSSLGVALGAWYRSSTAVMVASFCYLELLDVTNYLNHHYLAALLGLLLLVSPGARVASVDAWRARRGKARTPHGDAAGTVPALSIYLIRFQLAVVYFFAGLAKLGSDWLLHGQPLQIWLTPLVDVPVVGWVIAQSWGPLLLSWCGFLYDLTIWAFLLTKRTRPYAFAVVLVFHSLTWVFFDIGLFPWIMTAATLIFFSPSWPRHALAALRRLAARPKSHHSSGSHGADDRHASSPASAGQAGTSAVDFRWTPTRRLLGFFVVGYVALQVFVPLRHFALPSDVLWAEDGMRFSWKVMIRQKSGSLTYEVVGSESGRRLLISPSKYLTRRQSREMSGQPDLIVQLAHHIGRDFELRWSEPVQVRADSWLSFNGRRSTHLFDPQCDLMRVSAHALVMPCLRPRPKSAPPNLRIAERR